MEDSTERHPDEVMFSDAINRVQERLGTRERCAKLAARGRFRAEMSDDLMAFVATRRSFFFGTANGSGEPYIQHRGGRPGVLRAVDSRTLGFPDYAGNGHYMTLGNLSENPRAFLFLIDYPNQQRIKLWGAAEVVEHDPQFLGKLMPDRGEAPPQRGIRFRVDAWDVNCKAHIPKLYSEEFVVEALAGLQARIEQLEAALTAERRR